MTKQRHDKISHYEHDLIQKCKRGDFVAFRELMQRYQSRIYAVCYGIMRNREDALDVVQEVLIKVYESMHTFKGESGLYVWIYRIAVNKSLDFYRKRKRQYAIYDRVHDVVRKGDLGAKSETPDGTVLNLELKEVIHQAIYLLPDKQRGIIVLREIEGLSYQEIAKIMHCSVGTVMSRLFYARKRLMQLLSEYLEDRTGEVK